MGAEFISKTVEAPKDSITGSVIDSWSESRASYSGDWNTCSKVGKRIKFQEKYSESLKKADKKRLEEIVDNETKKWESTVIDMGIVGYDVITVKKAAKKSTAKFEKRYVVKNEGSDNVKDFKSAKDAKSFAEERSLKTGISHWISIEYVKSGSSVVCECNVTKKRVVRKPTRANVHFQEIHKYYVTALASI